MAKKTYDACIVCGYEYWGMSVDGVRSRLNLIEPYCGKHQELQKLGFDESDRTRTVQITMSEEQWYDLLGAVWKDSRAIESNKDVWKIINDALGPTFPRTAGA